MPEVLPPKLADAGSLEGRPEGAPVEFGPSAGPVPFMFGKTHALDSRDGSDRRSSSMPMMLTVLSASLLSPA
jgi:hypothetical protein